ncbi:GTP-binding protein [Nocardia sp. NPDC059240]|uniref:GTP-binding protein n=1 Tax=Nocardia sp. NPDC059240 TaxID=3346786 RepID=UPI00369B0B39
MGTKAIDPRSIRNVTLIGNPEATARLTHRLLRAHGTSDSPATIRWATDRIEHTIRVTELAAHAPMATLERSIRVADGLIAVTDAADNPRLQTMLRIADDHQVARLCLIHGLDHPTADFDRCLHTLAETRGATPIPLQTPGSDNVIDLIAMADLIPLAAETYGGPWKLAEDRYRTLAKTLAPYPSSRWHQRIRHLTRIGDIVPVLCGPTGSGNDTTTLLDAIIRYLPSPLDVCQPEHALDY